MQGIWLGAQIGSGTIPENANHQFALGTTVIRYYTVDVHGNTNTCSFSVTVYDDEDPYFVSCPEDIIIANDVDQCGAYLFYPEPTIFDNCEATLVRDADSPAPGSFFPVGTTTISYYIEDFEDITCIFDITVMDVQMPKAVCQDITVDLDADGNAVITPEDVDGGSSDNCDEIDLSINVNEF
ncbi:MAG: HYR domain-containing protein [Spirulinaceae cyanobacterium RM2_2_10]|nr:HYR domain-containing protein [Spirulinaceae cyanobacterium RM2_2_10]